MRCDASWIYRRFSISAINRFASQRIGVTTFNERLVPPKDAGALASAILDLIGDAELLSAYGKVGCERAEELFGMDAFLAAYENLFQKMGDCRKSKFQNHG